MAAPQSSGADPAHAPSVPTVSVDDKSTGEAEKSSLKKKLWPFGKKKDDKKEGQNAAGSGLTSTYPFQARSGSPAPPAAGMSAPTSPSQRVDSSSPRIASPASSQIFERNVQEESLAPADIPTAIPNHITTENHIPAALDAASDTITNKSLNPDNVEIVTHVAHQPAAATVAQGTGVGSTSGIAASTAGVHGGESLAAVVSPSLPATSQEAAAAAQSVPTTTSGPGMTAVLPATSTTLDDGASSYGDLNPTDVRRLSFISFADVVHHEQAQSVGSETASQIPGAGAMSPMPTVGSTLLPSPVPGTVSPMASPLARSPSPVRASSPPVRAPSPNFLSANAASPKMLGTSPSPPQGVSGELAVETMSQALRKTGSGDLSAARDKHVSEAGEGLGVR